MDEAARLYEEALKIYTKLHGRDHLSVARALSNLARLRHARGDAGSVRAALEASPALVNVTLSGRWPALHLAAEAQDPKAGEMLLGFGADPLAKNRDGKTPRELATDAEFMRRVYLDLTGTIPDVKTIRTFLVDQREPKVKRAELVNRLVGTPEFVDFWTNKWADLLQVNKKWLGGQGAQSLHSWIRGAVASNMPYDKFVASFLNSEGSTIKNPPLSR